MVLLRVAILFIATRVVQAALNLIKEWKCQLPCIISHDHICPVSEGNTTDALGCPLEIKCGEMESGDDIVVYLQY